MSKAEQLKEQGNKCFTSGDYTGAINYFSQAIRSQESAVYYSNRAACYLKLSNYSQALQDTTKCYNLDPTYVKGAQRHCEALIRTSNAEEAVRISNILFNAEQTSKNRELLNEAQRALKLTGPTPESFVNSVQTAAQNLLILTAQGTKAILNEKFQILSSQERAQDVKKADDFDMNACKLTEDLNNLRENLTNIGMKNLPEDLEFLQKSVPTFKIDPTVLCFYYVVMQNFRTTADAFIHFGLLGFTCDEEISKDKNYYIQHAAQQINLCPRNTQKMILQAALELQQQKIDQAQQTIGQLVKQDPRFASFVQNFQTWNKLKEQGSAEYKSNPSAAVQTFQNATLAIFNYNEIAGQTINQIDPFVALIFLAAEFLAAQTLSNEGMALSKLSRNEETLSRLSAATFLDQTYEKAHRRMAQIYYDAKMFLEAEREYAFAAVLTNDQELGKIVKDCQKQLRPFLRKDYYGILEIDKSVDPASDDYNKKYRKICAKWHPDRYARDPVMRRFAQIKFRLIQEADGILRDKQKKAIYDQGGDPENDGAAGMGGGMGMDMGGIDISQIFQMMGGGGRGGFQFSSGGGRQQRGGQQGRGGQGRGNGMPPGFENIFDFFG
ncbi:Chaperone_protein DnaJ [Hexamita inflata]|uniref:Chaperone protein DnaJ n=1 Tax=Hexamita inflata TaxID=28002 RepID=A0AA86TXS8_9EUKA|nr:Chaperone protein DnaJ [Hexamita inflata]